MPECPRAGRREGDESERFLRPDNYHLVGVMALAQCAACAAHLTPVGVTRHMRPRYYRRFLRAASRADRLPSDSAPSAPRIAASKLADRTRSFLSAMYNPLPSMSRRS